MKVEFKFRPIDRAVVAILAALNAANGLYLIGPWYLERTADGTSPLYTLFQSRTAICAYGIGLFLNGVALAFAARKRVVRTNHIFSLSNLLFAGFLIRLYSLIGVFVALEYWLPPTYLSHVATVLILGAEWVWIKRNERPIQ